MATQADARRIALSLPGTEESQVDFAFSVPDKKGKQKGFAWVWKERVHPKKPRVPNHAVLAIRVASLTDKDFIISATPDRYVIDPHYDGFPAVLVRLAEVKVPELRTLLTEAWRCMAPADLVNAPKPAAKRAPAKRPSAKKAPAKRPKR